jgi:predicted RNA binding protein YcfA (HicA-like mRNA interferase family)
VKQLLLAIAGLCLLSGAQIASASSLTERQKSGPVTLIGVAIHVHSGGFTLTTKTHGIYQVTVSSSTAIQENGRTGKLVIHEGDHVYVRGFVNGRSITAIRISIRVLKPKKKLYDLVGDVSSVSATQLVIVVSGKSRSVHLTAATTVRVVSTTGSVSQIHRGDHVQVRVQDVAGDLTALHIRVYARKPGQRIGLHGTVAGVGNASVTVLASGRRYVVLLTGQTTIYFGNQLASAGALKPGQDVRVFACCQGGSLTASSIHIRKVSVTVHAVTLRGRVLSIQQGVMRLATAAGTVSVSLSPSTPVQLGTAPDRAGDIRVGDDVSVRAVRAGPGYRAEKVRIYIASRKPRTLVGSVVRLISSGFVVRDAAGKETAVMYDRGTAVAVGSRPGRTADIKVGSRVRVVARPNGVSGLLASTVRITPVSIAARSIDGTIVSAGPSRLVIASTSGARYTVLLGKSTQVQLNGRNAPPDAVFPGAKIKARGTLSGHTLTATSVTLTLRSVSATGRITGVRPASLTLIATRSRLVEVDLPAHVRLSDGGKQIAAGSLRAGAFAQATGWEVKANVLRATSVQVMHPQLTLAATASSTGSGSVTVQTAAGDRYTLRFSTSSVVESARTHIQLLPQEIPSGTRVHVIGTVGSDGTLLVSEMSVQLSAVSLRGLITSLGAKAITLSSGAGTVRGTLAESVTFEQGTHQLIAADIVVGDDVTVYGYRIASGVLVRKVLVHRPRVTISGTVAAINADGFNVAAADGAHRVLVSGSTVVTGDSIAVGFAVHVSGYRRGDGAILALTVKLTKPKVPFLIKPQDNSHPTLIRPWHDEVASFLHHEGRRDFRTSPLTQNASPAGPPARLRPEESKGVPIGSQAPDATELGL